MGRKCIPLAVREFVIADLLDGYTMAEVARLNEVSASYVANVRDEEGIVAPKRKGVDDPAKQKLIRQLCSMKWPEHWEV